MKVQGLQCQSQTHKTERLMKTETRRNTQTTIRRGLTQARTTQQARKITTQMNGDLWTGVQAAPRDSSAHHAGSPWKLAGTLRRTRRDTPVCLRQFSTPLLLLFRVPPLSFSGESDWLMPSPNPRNKHKRTGMTCDEQCPKPALSWRGNRLRQF